MSSLRTYVATHNAHKLGEMRILFEGSALHLETFEGYAEVEEGDDSYVDNALLKARALHHQLRDAGIDAAVLADDSGIEVDALDGRPGVLSARYAGVATPWQERLETMLGELHEVANDRRGARFVCAMALVRSGRPDITVIEVVEGRIATQPRGANGFGYDPIFIDVRDGRTFGELRSREKDAISHRRRAADAVLARLGAAPV